MQAGGVCASCNRDVLLRPHVAGQHAVNGKRRIQHTDARRTKRDFEWRIRPRNPSRGKVSPRDRCDLDPSWKLWYFFRFLWASRCSFAAACRSAASMDGDALALSMDDLAGLPARRRCTSTSATSGTSCRKPCTATWMGWKPKWRTSCRGRGMRLIWPCRRWRTSTKCCRPSTPRSCSI